MSSALIIVPVALASVKSAVPYLNARLEVLFVDPNVTVFAAAPVAIFTAAAPVSADIATPPDPDLISIEEVPKLLPILTNDDLAFDVFDPIFIVSFARDMFPKFIVPLDLTVTVGPETSNPPDPLFMFVVPVPPPLPTFTVPFDPAPKVVVPLLDRISIAFDPVPPLIVVSLVVFKDPTVTVFTEAPVPIPIELLVASVPMFIALVPALSVIALLAWAIWLFHELIVPGISFPFY